MFVSILVSVFACAAAKFNQKQKLVIFPYKIQALPAILFLVLFWIRLLLFGAMFDPVVSFSVSFWRYFS